ncbi:EAL domain-containing protein [Ningiella sp. W23]|uniref:bifunctional diguanylate cyclase/phosphodiesterase n=1 Tax=Ningiella sp. W23 TaxID=3023715 RepID=UPI0037578E3F
MSLSKQLGFGFFFVLLFTLVGILWMNTTNARAFIEQQLSSHAQDTATSLGLSISPHIGEESSLSIIETMINAIYDQGFYRSITLSNADDAVILQKGSQSQTEAPKWFVELFEFDVAEGVSQINDGWSIKGSLVVKSNKSEAYDQLWQNAVQSFIVILVAFCLSLVFVWFLVKRVITGPINAVINQADAISQKQFQQIQIVPTTTELSRFVKAINNMSEKLYVMFKKLSNQSEEYRRFAYADFVTGVGNRRAFELAIKGLLNDSEASAQGYLFLIRASSLKSIHTNFGGEAGDKYLKTICQSIKEAAAAEYEHFSLYRLNGSDFALIIENLREANAKTMAQLLAIYTKRAERNEHVDGVAHISAAPFCYQDSYKSVMERIDTTLITAMENESRWEISSSESVSFSNAEWNTKIRHIVEDGRANFVAQDILSKNKNLIYSEWFARIKDSRTNDIVPMNQLIPASIRLDHSIEIDKLIVQNLFVLAAETNNRIGVNINRISLFNSEFIEWLFEKLDVYRSVCPNIVIEIPERALVNDIHSLATLTSRLKSYGIDICIEHFGAQLAGIAHIRQIMPDFLKIDGRFTHDVHNQADNQLFVGSLINIAHGLDIRVLVEKVESEEDYLWLKSSGVEGFQGFYLSQPSAVQSAAQKANN